MLNTNSWLGLPGQHLAVPGCLHLCQLKLSETDKQSLSSSITPAIPQEPSSHV